MSRIPPLPEPYGWLHDGNGNDPLTFTRTLDQMMPLVCSTLGVYTADQLRARDRQIVEACAKVCEAQEGDALTKAVAKGCAAALRSLLGEGEGNSNGS